MAAEKDYLEMLTSDETVPDFIREEVAAFGRDRGFRAFYAESPSGAWLLHAAARFGVERRAIVAAVAACARAVLRYVPKEEGRPARAVEVAEAWARGEVRDEECDAAAVAATQATAELLAVAQASGYDPRRAAATLAADAATRAAGAASSEGETYPGLLAHAAGAIERAAGAVTHGEQISERAGDRAGADLVRGALPFDLLSAALLSCRA